MHGRGKRVENVRNSSNPTSYEPVKTMPSMPGFSLELVADRVARAHDEVDHAVRDAGVAVGLEDAIADIARPRPA